MSAQKINIALVGLGFGAEFIPIYKDHPGVAEISICQRNVESLNAIGDSFHIEKRFTNLDDVLADPTIDAVHINTPIEYHGRQAIAVLEAGKHVACTVPMATTTEDCEAICRLVKEKNLTYMMMETVIYSREFLFIQELYKQGKLGDIQFLQATHQQDMEDWPGYWEGLPPMHYATHCVGPCLALTKDRASHVSCLGSGKIQAHLEEKYNSPFAVECAQIKFHDSHLSARIMRSLFDTARQYRESIDVYGTKMSFEWPLIEDEGIVLHTEKNQKQKSPNAWSAQIMLTFYQRAFSNIPERVCTTVRAMSISVLNRVQDMGAHIHILPMSLFLLCLRSGNRTPMRQSLRI